MKLRTEIRRMETTGATENKLLRRRALRVLLEHPESFHQLLGRGIEGSRISSLS